MRFSGFLFASAITLTLNISLFAQQPAKTRSDKQYDKAVQLYKRGEYAGVMHILNDLTTDDPKYVNGWLLKADVYYDQKEYSNAVASYKKAVEVDSVIFPPAYYIMANLYFDLEKYDDAKTNYLKYLTFHPKIQAELKRTAENLILCDFRMKMMKNPVPFNPVNIGPNINSAGYEYINAVSLDESQLYFTRKGANPNSDESFYRSVSARSSTGQLNWSPAIEIGAPINTPGYEGALCVSPDGMTIFITCCSRRDSTARWERNINHGPQAAQLDDAAR